MRRGGFSLLEILFAILILGTSLVVVIGHVNHGVRMYRIARETVIATSIAQTKLQAVVSPPPGDSVHTMDEAGPVAEDGRFSYHVSVTEAELPGIEKELLSGLYRAEVVVEWTTDVRREVRLVQLVVEKPNEDVK